MLILAIDTTGFSASIALVRDGKEVLFHKIGSGFTPEKVWNDFVMILPAHHQKFLLNNTKNLFKKSSFQWEDIDAIAVSAYSGIYNCLLVGQAFAEALAYAFNKPLIKVDHILAHVYSTWLERTPDNFQFPILVFSASGSHSDFSLLPDKKRCRVISTGVPKQKKGEVQVFLGIGKVFYQLGKRLGLVTPADSDINRLIRATKQGNPYRFDFSGYYQGSLLDLNFSDFMSSIDDFVKKQKKKTAKLPLGFVRDTAASFQESISEILAGKIIRLAEMKKVKEVHITGGVSENKYLRKKLKGKFFQKKSSFVLRYPIRKEYRLDNAAMIGALAYYQKKYQIKFINFKPSITQ
jgi:N6-L-threonylcarbamoyladenine synthase